MDFEDFLTQKNDIIDNAAYSLLTAVYGRAAELEWDMEMIGSLVDYAEMLLLKRGICTCHPYYFEDSGKEGKEIPCYLDEGCTRKDCVFKTR